MPEKYILDLRLTGVERLSERYFLLRATRPEAPLPTMLPGQFAQLRVDGSATTFLRRPISIHNVDRQKNEVWFLVQAIGEGTRCLAAKKAGDVLNAVLPLGHGFTMPQSSEERLLHLNPPSCWVSVLQRISSRPVNIVHWDVFLSLLRTDRRVSRVSLLSIASCSKNASRTLPYAAPSL